MVSEEELRDAAYAFLRASADKDDVRIARFLIPLILTLLIRPDFPDNEDAREGRSEIMEGLCRAWPEIANREIGRILDCVPPDHAVS